MCMTTVYLLPVTDAMHAYGNGLKLRSGYWCCLAGGSESEEAEPGSCDGSHAGKRAQGNIGSLCSSQSLAVAHTMLQLEAAKGVA